MLANANPLEAAPASRSVREFIAVCARDNVPYGDLNCLPALLRELGVNKHFAMHFWSAVAGMTEKQSAGTEVVLAAIVEAVTGRTLANVREAGPAHRILLGRLERLLAGQELEPEELSAPEPTPKLTAPNSPRPVASQPVEDVLPIRKISEKRRRSRRHTAAEDEPIAPITNPAWTRDESLRLVLLPETPETAVAEPLVSRTADPSTRARLKPELAAAEARPVAAPLSSYAETAPRRWIPAGVLVGALVVGVLGGGGYLILRNGGSETLGRLSTSVQAGYGSAMAAWKNDPARATPAAVNPSETPPVASRQITPQAPAISNAPQPAPPAPLTRQPAAQRARSSPSALTPEQNMAALAAYNQQRDTSESSGATGGSTADAVQVPESAMNARLVTSRVPVLSDEARASGITGVVRMQATINRNGFVSRLHVLQGPAELRHSALEAVSTWRYRPYLVDGQPVDVITTVTVDFSSLE